MSTLLATILLAAVLAAMRTSSDSQDIFDAVRKNDIEAVKSLIAEDPARLYQKGLIGRSLLHYAAASDDPAMIEYLLEMGIPVDPRSDYGNTPLFWAIRARNPDTAACLIKNGADVNVANDAGMTPGAFAVSKNDTGMVELLTEHGVDISKRTQSGDTYLHAAAYEGLTEMAALLLEKGLDPNIPNSRGFTALDLALDRGNTQVQKLLENNGAKGGTGEIALVGQFDNVGTPGPGLDKPVKVTIIYDNYPCEAHVESGWGFSCYIEGTEQNILFDTGTRSSLFIRNLDETNIDPREIDTIFLSHEHGDHTGGLFRLLEVNHDVTVIMPHSFSYNFVSGVQATGAKAVTNQFPAKLLPNVYVSGEMDSRMTNEQSLAINTSKGLVVIVGCSHPGIVNIVRKFRENVDRDIYAVLGGFHLMNDSEDQVKLIIDQLKALGVQKCGASHCTGDRQIEMFKEAFGDNYIAMGAGQEIVFQ